MQIAYRKQWERGMDTDNESEKEGVGVGGEQRQLPASPRRITAISQHTQAPPPAQHHRIDGEEDGAHGQQFKADTSISMLE